MTSLQALFRCAPPDFLQTVDIHTPSQAVEDCLTERYKMVGEIRQHLLKGHVAQSNMQTCIKVKDTFVNMM